MRSFSTDNLIKAYKINFPEYSLPSKNSSDVGSSFVSEKFQDSCRCVSIHHAVWSSYNHQGNGQVDQCIKYVKRTREKCFETKADISMALIWIKLIPISPRLQSLATLLFNRPARGILPKFSILPVLCDNNENNHIVLVNRQPHAYVDVDKNIPFQPTGHL